MSFAPANSPGMSASNGAAMGAVHSATIAATAVGWNLWDSTAGGTRLLYGTVTANIGFKAADNATVAAGNCIIVCS